MKINFYLCCIMQGDAVPLHPLLKGHSPLRIPILNCFRIHKWIRKQFEKGH